MGSQQTNLSTSASTQPFLQNKFSTIMKGLMLLTLLITLSLVIDLSNSFWIARARGGRGGRFTRWGRSDPAMVEDYDVEDYEDDGELLNALADLLQEKEKKSFSSLVRNRDMRSLSSMYGKRGPMMNPMAKNKGLGK